MPSAEKRKLNLQTHSRFVVYLFDEVYRLSNDFPERCFHSLSPQRREKMLSYRFPLDKKLSVTAYLLLRLALLENHGIDEPVVFSCGKNGKPILRDYSNIHFSLSHCLNAVACAVSGKEIGVDVQEIVPVSDGLAKRVLTTKEYDVFKAAENPYRKFCEYWVVKESFLKKTGDGIGTDLSELSADFEDTFFVNGGDYCCCVAGASGSLRRVSAPELSYYAEESICTRHF